MRHTEGGILLNTTFASAGNSISENMDNYYSLCAQVVMTNKTPNAFTFATTDVTVAADTITKTAHTMVTGLKVRFSTTTTLPGGLSAATDYWVIVVDANTFKVGSTLNNALAGTAIDLTSQGVGTHTCTPTAIAGAVITPQISNDNVTWTDETASAITYSADGSAFVKPTFMARWWRLKYTATAGQLLVVATLNGESDGGMV